MMGTHTQHVRMNDYVGPGVYATVTWATSCCNPVAPNAKDAGHFLGLMSHTCTRCGRKPLSITYDGQKEAERREP